jgi:uncharacterized protein (TIGR00251 family)
MTEEVLPWSAAAAAAAGGTLLRIRLTPRSSKEGIEGVAEGRLMVRVASPPTDGRANKALVKLLARELDIPPSRIEVVKGAGSRLKVVLVRGWAPPVIKEGGPGKKT